jgi:hypothetical protein
MMRAIAAALLVSLVVACGGPPLPADKRDYAGDWRGTNMRLLIATNGNVSYERVRTGEHTTINASIQRFEGASFFVGLGPVTTRFEVTKPPHQEGSVWKMTVDGVELTRAAVGAGDDRSA